ncbi:MAG: cobalamin biosynthesis protein [Dehalococcoidales bacterium]|nr:cobalamin biosynthesis protein [Dehalococcoidales bacterium]
MEILLILVLAITLDLTIGEPPRAIHPVVWMGKVVSFLVRVGKGRANLHQFFLGMGIVLVTVGLFTIPVFLILFYLKSLNLVAYVVVGSLFLKTTFSLKELRRSALVIKTLLAKDKLPEARFELRSLVGRDTASLDKSLMISATVESVAENTCDSFTAPLFYFLFFGVPGAIAYRAVNTLDAMIGYHGEFEFLGKFAARVDTIVNLIPARITALLIILASWLRRQSASDAWRIMLRDRRKTESPNAGWTMSAIAGALRVHLEKVGYYELGDSHNPLTIDTVDISVQLITTAALIWIGLLFLAEVIYRVAT